MAISSVYFYCLPQGTKNRPAYQYQSIVLAQGLKSLGIKVYANINYWRNSINTQEFLFNNDPSIKSTDSDVIIVPCQWRSYGFEYPKEVLNKDGNYKTVFIDVCDGLFTSSFEKHARNFDLILKQKTRGLTYPENCKFPWVFGLSDELIKIASTDIAFENRNKSITVNFRHKHAIRDLAKKSFISKISSILKPDETYETLNFSYDNTKIVEATSDEELLFMQSGGRHYIKYIQRMQNAMACAAFGGNFMMGDDLEHSQLKHVFANYFIAGRAGGKITNALDKLKIQKQHTYHVYQWDSWRFWESLACGCLTLHLDFEKYGIQLPEMPINGVHYIGVDLRNPQLAIDKMNAMSMGDFKSIAESGRQWALNHYSPKQTAVRFLSYIS